MDPEGRAVHWDEVYRRRGARGVSWYQPAPVVSLELVQSLGVAPTTPVLDVGGGASGLADALVATGFEDVTVLDVSAVALAAARSRLGDPSTVHWVLGDVCSWRPDRRYGLWHDRAVFHFMVEDADRAAYLDALRAAVAPGGAVVVAAFAPDGPEQCSGLPTARYSADELAASLGEELELAAARVEHHTTPAGAVQPFTWVAGRLAS